MSTQVLGFLPPTGDLNGVPDSCLWPDPDIVVADIYLDNEPVDEALSLSVTLPFKQNK